MCSKPDVWQGILTLMILKTLAVTGALRGYERMTTILARFLNPKEGMA